MVCFHQWTKSYRTVKAVFPSNRTILFAQPAPFYYGQFVKVTTQTIPTAGLISESWLVFCRTLRQESATISRERKRSRSHAATMRSA